MIEILSIMISKMPSPKMISKMPSPKMISKMPSPKMISKMPSLKMISKMPSLKMMSCSRWSIKDDLKKTTINNDKIPPKMSF